MWLKDYAGMYAALKQDWSETVKPLMLLLEGKIRDHLFDLVQKAYTSIHLDKFCMFLGMSADKALEGGWYRFVIFTIRITSMLYITCYIPSLCTGVV